MSTYSARRPRFGGGQPQRRNNNRRFTNSYSSQRRGRSKAPGIDPRRFVQAAKPSLVRDYTPVNQFDGFAMNDLLKTNIKTKGFDNPSHIQDKVIPHALEGKDVIGIAGTGTGKTVAFALPVINKLIGNPKSQALIVAPTRELAQQIEAEFRDLGYGARLYTTLVIGGAPMYRQTQDLRRGSRIVIGTPGRLVDHVKRGNLRLAQFDTFVLDEVDRMVDMGFIKDVRFLFEELSANRQSMVFSATLGNQIEGLVRTFLVDPIKINVSENENSSSNVEQNIVSHSPTNKIDKLHDILLEERVEKTLIFGERKRDVEKLTTELRSRGFKADAIHGDKTQGYRQRALRDFRDNQINILVATDVAARGIDVPDVTHVINYDTPETYADYVHRIGRVGRANKVGYALTFVTESAGRRGY